MGSTGEKKLFLDIVKTLASTSHNIIVVYTTILQENELPNLGNNVLFKKFVKSPLTLSKYVDLTICHGGRGTIYTVAYSGKPAICLPMFIEHQYNIDSLVRHGCAIRISKRFFKSRELLNAIDTIFGNYDYYLNNSQKLERMLTKIPGEITGVKRLVELINKESL